MSEKYHIKQCKAAVKSRDVAEFLRHIAHAPSFVFMTMETMMAPHPSFEGDELTEEFFMLLSLRNHFDINANIEGEVNALQYAFRAGKVKQAHLLIQAGADIKVTFPTHIPGFEKGVDLYGAPDFATKEQSIMLQSMLLSCGLIPLYPRKFIEAEVKATAHKWIQALHAARSYFKVLFNNSSLEEELVAFIYNEEALLTAMS